MKREEDFFFIYAKSDEEEVFFSRIDGTNKFQSGGTPDYARLLHNT